MKNPEKIFSFWDAGVWNICGKFCMLLPEYLSSVVNALINSLKISHKTECDFYNSVYLELTREEGISGAVLISAVFGTR